MSHVSHAGSSERRRAPALLALLLASLLVVPCAGCGTLLFAERQDQGDTGRLDPNVVLLDAVGLLFFIVPGLVAFVVDYHTDAIYLPEGVERGEGPFFHDR